MIKCVPFSSEGLKSIFREFMPQDPAEGWIPGDRLTLPAQRLELSEIDSFLQRLFSDLARTPKMLRLRETAAVVRYLRLLTLYGVPRRVAARGSAAVRGYPVSSETAPQRDARWSVGKQADILWGELANRGEIHPCNPGIALRFLKSHSETYLANPYTAATLDFVRDFVLPPKYQDPFKPPSLRSRSMSVDGDRNPYLQNDVSERIYAAYLALKRAGVRGVRQRIAKALEQAKVTRRKGRQDWLDQDVNDRVKRYERHERERLRKVASGKSLEDRFEVWCDDLENRWIADYRWKLICEDIIASGRFSGGPGPTQPAP